MKAFAARLLAPSLILAATSTLALAETVVKVTLWDQGESSMEGAGMHAPLGLAVDGADPAMATMGVTLDVQEVPAGEITFKITNDSREFYHAVTISPVADPPTLLPYLTEENRVDEAAAMVAANLGELRPHDFKAKTTTLTPGT